MLGVINAVLLILFTIPVLVPSLCIATPPGSFGCKASMDVVWPGTWLLFAFVLFITVDVLGSFAWATMFHMGSTLSGKTETNGKIAWLSMAFFEIGTLGATALVAAIGYVGGRVVVTGGSNIVSAEAIRTQIIPPFSSDPTSPLNDMPPVVEAVLIGVALLGLILGLLAYFMSKRETASAPMSTSA